MSVEPQRIGERLLEVLGLLAVLSVVLWMGAWRWPDLLVDFGEELYVPWQMLEGRVLYEEMVYLRGPFSAWVNWAAFGVLGVGLESLVLVNVSIIVALTLLIHGIFGTAGSRLSRICTSLTFVLVFAAAQYSNTGNYNYVTPYSHEQSHAILLGLLGIACLGRFARRSSPAWLAISGLTLGAAALTKPELFAACAAGISVGLGVSWYVGALSRREVLRAAAWVVAGGVVALAAAAALGVASGTVNPKDMLFAWLEYPRWSRLVGADPMTLSVLGFDKVGRNISLMLLVAGAWILLLGVLAVVARALNARGVPRAACVVAGALVTLLPGFLLLDPQDWLYRAMRPAPVLLAGWIVAQLFEARRIRKLDAPEREQHALAFAARRMPVLAVGAMGLVLLARMPLKTQVFHYGFALAMPATLVLVHGLVHDLPRRLQAWSAGGPCFVAGAVALLVLGWTVHAEVSLDVYGKKNTWVAGTFRAFDEQTDNRTLPFSDAVAWLSNHLSPDEQFVVFPEGVMLNVLAKRSSTTRFTTYNPALFLILGGEDPVLQDLRSSPPDYVVLVDRDNSEHGARYFGQDYAKAVGRWMRRRYEPVVTFGAPPFQGRGFGIAIMRRNAGR